MNDAGYVASLLGSGVRSRFVYTSKFRKAFEMIGELIEESVIIWQAGGPLMIPLSLLAFALFFSEINLLLRLRSLSNRLELSPEKALGLRADCSIPDAFSRARRRILEPVDRRIRYYAILVGLCPLLGLLGTVAGMTSTFEGIARPSLTDLSGEVAGGISEALVTTQAGLLVAIPGTILLSLLRRSRDRVSLATFERESLELKRPAGKYSRS